jgi:hypothetical protein
MYVAIIIPLPLYGREIIFLHTYSTIPLTTFAHYVRSLRLWNDKPTQIYQGSVLEKSIGRN